MPAEGVQQAAVGGYLDERAIGMLAVDFRQRGRDLAQQVQAHGLVVDGRAAWAIGILDAADNEFALSIHPLLLQDDEGGMRAGQCEGRRDDAALSTRPHQRGIAAGAQRQAQRIEQDGFAGTRLAGEHGEAFLERNVELLDQDDVANGKGSEHGRRL